jgi:hypothetical protein
LGEMVPALTVLGSIPLKASMECSCMLCIAAMWLMGSTIPSCLPPSMSCPSTLPIAKLIQSKFDKRDSI